MKKAIITGSNGFVGSAVVSELLKNDIEVLALGRKSSTKLVKTNNYTYLQIDLRDIDSLPEKIQKLGWKPGESCIFYNFSWSGANGLTDGTIKDQIKNITYSAKSVIAAKKIGCTKFINVGTMEETFMEKFLDFDWKNKNYHSGQDIYAISKVGSRDMCKLNAYLNKIDYVHTRFSVFIDEHLSANSYVHKVLRNIKNGKEYNTPQNKELFDIISLKEGAIAYRLIGETGINNADYFIGSGDPKPLFYYFEKFKKVVSGLDNKKIDDLDFNDKILTPNSFCIKKLIKDTGFMPKISFEDFIKKY